MHKIIDRIKSGFNASVAEVGSNDLWQIGEIGVAMVANNAGLLESKLQKVMNMLEDMYLAEIIEKAIEIIPANEGIYPGFTNRLFYKVSEFDE